MSEQRTKASFPAKVPHTPLNINREQVKAACRNLGLDPGEVREIHMHLNHLIVEVFVRHEDGSVCETLSVYYDTNKENS